ncbi:MAG: dTMP kinase [Planctomycetota bacterium]
MPDRHPLSGKFIVLDGGEGCGKSTQMKRLYETLTSEGATVAAVRDPGSTATGERIRDLLLDPQSEISMRCEMLLYMAARAQLVPETIRPALDRGEVVLADRFFSSTHAYQLGGDGLTFDDIADVARVATAGCTPNLTLILDVPTEVAQERVVPKYVPLFEGTDVADKDRIERRPTEYHARVRQKYLDLARREPERHAVVDATGDSDAVAAAVYDTLLARLSSK